MNMHGGFKEIIFFKFWITESVGGIFVFVKLKFIFFFLKYYKLKKNSSVV